MIRATALGAILLMVAGACAEGSDDSAAETTIAMAGGSATTITAAPPPPTENVGDARTDEVVGFGSGGIEPVVAQPVDLGRDIIFTADLTIAVPDVAAAGDRATRVIQGLGGYLFGQRTTGEPEASSVLTFKVFPEDFQEALDRLGSIGDLRSQTVSTDDVTERIVDLQSRINTAAVSVERLRGLLAGAGSIEMIAQLENQLLERETQLETLRGQLRTLENQVALATIVVTLTEAAARPELRLDVTAFPGHDRAGLSCPGTAALAVHEGADLTLCFEVTNAGDTPLTDLELRDPVLGIELDDLLVVDGDPAATLEPGQTVLLAYETSAGRDLRTRTTATADPVDPDGNRLPGRETATTTSLFVDAVDPGGIPGFREGLETSWHLLLSLGALVVLVIAGLVPFLWVPVVAWLGYRAVTRRRRSDHASPATPEPDAIPVGPAT